MKNNTRYLIFITLFICFLSINLKAQQNCIKGDCIEGFGIQKGKLTDGSSYIYEGNFKNGMFNGKGILKAQNNNAEYDGNFINNKFTCSNCSLSYQINEQKFFEYGQFVENKLKDGFREINFTNQKQVYTGTFQNDELKNGKQEIINQNGQIEIIEIVNFTESNITSNTLNYYYEEDIIGPLNQMIDLRVDGKKLHLEIKFTNEIILSSCIFDTGAHGLSLNYKTFKALKDRNLAEKLNIDNIDFLGVGGTDKSFLIKIYSVKLGDFTLKNVIADVSYDINRDFTLVGINFFDKFNNVIWNKKDNTLELFK